MLGAVRLMCLCLGAAVFAAGQGRARGWRGIVPLHSTRADVERLLGPSRGPESYAASYHLAEESVFVEYSSGPCSARAGGRGWNVPPDTVIRIRVTPAEGPMLSDLQLDRKKYKQAEDSHVLGYVYYNNLKEGIRISAYNGRVSSIEYGATAPDKHLHCPRPKTQEPRDD